MASGNIGTVLILLLAPRREPNAGMARGLQFGLPVAMVFGLFAFVVQEVPREGSAAGGGWWHEARG